MNVAFPPSKDIDGKIADYALELDTYQAQDYIRTFMRSNALLTKQETECPMPPDQQAHMRETLGVHCSGLNFSFDRGL